MKKAAKQIFQLGSQQFLHRRIALDAYAIYSQIEYSHLCIASALPVYQEFQVDVHILVKDLVYVFQKRLALKSPFGEKICYFVIFERGAHAISVSIGRKHNNLGCLSKSVFIQIM